MTLPFKYTRQAISLLRNVLWKHDIGNYFFSALFFSHNPIIIIITISIITP